MRQEALAELVSYIVETQKKSSITVWKFSDVVLLFVFHLFVMITKHIYIGPCRRVTL